MRTIRTALALACGLLPFAASAAGAAPDAGVAFQVEPAAGSSAAPGGGYFVVAGAPGQSLAQAVDVHNESGGPLDLRLSAVDAATAQTGGTSFGADTDKATRTGTWVVLDRTSLSLGPGASTTVGFRVTVPAGTSSGVHLAGISVSVPPTIDGASGPVTLQSRRVIAVQVNLPGPSEPELVITGVAPVVRPDGLYVEMAVENRGGGLTNGEGDISLAADDFARTFDVGTFVPGTSIAYPLKWTDDTVAGDHPAHVEIRYGTRLAVWDGTLTVGAPAPQGQATPRVAPAAQTPSRHALPVVPVAAGIACAAALLAGHTALDRRSRAERSGPQ